MSDSRRQAIWAWGMLPARLLFFAAWQAIFALGFLASGSSDAWNASAAWWPFTVTLSNVLCVIMLNRLYRQEGERFWAIFRFQREHVRRDIWVFLGVLVISGPVAMLPNILGARWLFGDQQVALDLLIRPLPAWAAYSGALLFPVTQSLAELAVYFAYIMPRLIRQTGRPWLALSLSSLFLAAQHVAVPLLFDWRFIVWRLVMFLPFALMLGWVLHRRPRLLPYLVILHGLMDLSLAPLLIMVAK